MQNTTLELLAEVAYSKFASYRSAKYWYGSEPLWGELNKDDQEFWLNFIKGIRTGFKTADSTKLEEAK